MASATVTEFITQTVNATAATASATSDNRATPQGGVFEHVNPTHYDPSNPIVLFIIQASIVIILTRIIHFPLTYIRQPRVIAEVITGIILGPSVMGRIPGFSAAIFPPSRFAVYGGQSDFLLGGLAVGSAGCIAAFANVFPKSVARLYRLWEAGRQEEALALQKTLSLAESPTKAGIANTKYATAVVTAPRAGIQNSEYLLRPRRPYTEPAADAKAKIRSVMTPILRLEDVSAEVEVRSRL